MGTSALAAACTGAPTERPALPPGPKPTIGIDASGPKPWRALDHLDEAQITLPEGQPVDTDASGTMPLLEKWVDTKKTWGRMRIWSHPLPFPCDMPRPNYAPLGAQFYHGDVELPFIGGLANAGRGGWYVEDNRVYLISMENPTSWTVKPELRVTELTETLRRRTFAGSGLTPAAFVRSTNTVGPVTRPGMLVPAPGKVTFTITIPPSATLDVGATLLAHPLLGDRAGNGAIARVEVDGESVWRANVSPGDGFADGTADLSRWGGKTVTVSFSSDPDGDAAYDSVFFSSPVIRGPKPESGPRHIVVVGVDTLRWDALSMNGQTVDGRKTSPELDSWAQSAVVFDDAWGPAPRTRPSFRTALTGRYPYDAIAAPTVAQLLAPAGFRTAGFVANVHLVPRFRFNDGFEHWYYENGARAEDEVSRALEWLDAHKDEDTYTFVHFMDPHTYYNAPEPFGSRFVDSSLPLSGPATAVPEIFDRWQILQLMRRKKLSASDKRLVHARYDGEVAYLSNSLTKLFDGVDALPGRSVTVVHSDHGEEFWDHDGYEHNHTLYSELVHTVLMIRPPGGWGGGPHHVSAAVGLIDIVPTLLDLVGLHIDTPLDGRSLRAFVDAGADPTANGAAESTLAEALHDRPLAIGHLMFDKERWGVVFQDWKYILQTESGEEELYDLRADAGEHSNRISDAPAGRVDAMRTALAVATGWPIEQVWRVELHGALDTFRVSFPIIPGASPTQAGIIDPEAGESTRANLEWGEKPRLQTTDVGELHADAEGWLFRPQRAAGQTLWFACGATCADGTVAAADTSGVPLREGEVEVGGMKLKASKGWMLRPTRTEADALAALPVSTAGSSEEMQQLQMLGYVEPD